MANEEHLAKLKEGVEAWNHWRRDHPEITKLDLSSIDFSFVNLRLANLHEADLDGANLRNTDLNGANLSRADLHRANLSGADLSGAHLNRANLSNADLRDTDLSWADLSGVHLYGTNLHTTNLSRADLSGAYLYETTFINTNLTEVQGLERCRHNAPSTLDHRTLQQSGTLPLVFLRGCGLPDILIDYLPSLLNQPIQYYSCFISYSHYNEDFAQRLYADLQNDGVRCWYAPEDMKIGDRIRTRLDEVIRIHDKLLLILSEHSVISDWVEQEVETAFEKESQHNETVLLPIRLDETVNDSQTGWAAHIRRTRHIGNFSSWKDHDQYQNAFKRLLRDLKSGLSNNDSSK